MCTDKKTEILMEFTWAYFLAIFELRKLMMIIIIISASKAILKFTVFYAFASELRQMVLRLYDQLFLSLRSSAYKFILPFFMLLQKYLKLTLWYALTANFPLSIIRIRFCVRIYFKVEPFGPAYLVSFSQKMKFASNSIELTFKFWSSLIGNFKFQIKKKHSVIGSQRDFVDLGVNNFSYKMQFIIWNLLIIIKI